MENNNFDIIRKDGRLLYEYMRGSTVYGTAIEGKSDIDTGGVFLSNPNTLLGLNLNYKDYIADAKGDNSWYELIKWVKGLATSNSTMLESLFIPDKFVLYKNPILTPFFENRDLFLTKQIYHPFFSFAYGQIKKASGLHKKIVNPMNERLGLLDFCYVPRLQGSTKIVNWLDYRGLKQKYCGVTNVPNMLNCHYIFYDWGKHFKEEGITYDMFWDIPKDYVSTTELTHMFKNDLISEEEYNKRYRKSQIIQMFEFIDEFYGFRKNSYMGVEDWFNEQLKLERNYRGIITENADTTEVRLSSILKDEMPLIMMSYNKDGFSQHCKKWKEYKTWEKERNPERYNDNQGFRYDSKNLSHSFRVLLMCEEVLNGKGLIVDRREVGDAQFLLDVRNHKYTYEELMKLCEEKQENINKALKESKLLEKIDLTMVDSMLRDVQLDYLRKQF